MSVSFHYVTPASSTAAQLHKHGPGLDFKGIRSFFWLPYNRFSPPWKLDYECLKSSFQTHKNLRNWDP